MSFRNAFSHTVGLEGLFSNHPADRGGATKYGVTEAVARAFGYTGPMELLPLEVAEAIYKKKYWDVLKGDQLDAASPAVAKEVFDTSVNMGVSTSGEFLQRGLNVLNRNKKDYDDLVPDGIVGSKTTSALHALIHIRGKSGEIALLKILNGLQVARYVAICERDPLQEAFMLGWLQNRVVI